jgi:hypothetical protein
LQISQAEGWHKSQVVFGERFTDGQSGKASTAMRRTAEVEEARVAGCSFKTARHLDLRCINCRTVQCLFNVEVPGIEFDVVRRLGKVHVPFHGFCGPSLCIRLHTLRH